MYGFDMLSTLAQDDGGAAAAGFGLMGFVCLIVVYVLFMWLCYFKVFEKAGIPGWHAFVPILNIIDLLKIAGRPIWWIVLFLIPIVSLVIMVLVCLDIARKFGKGAGFGIGLALLGIIFFPILGFGSATYNKAA